MDQRPQASPIPDLARANLRIAVGRVIAAMAAAAIVVALAWWIVVSAAADQLAPTLPKLALKLAPSNTQALLAAAESAISSKPSSAGAAAPFLNAAVRFDPVDARAYNDMGVLAVIDRDAPRADRMFAIAARLSRRQTPAEIWRFVSEAQRGDYPQAWDALDVIFRVRDSAVDPLAPMIAALLASPGALPPFSAMLSSDPPWREVLVTQLAKQPANREMMVAALAALRRTRHPAIDAETAGLLRAEIESGDYVHAFDDWRALAPSAREASRTALNNGRFRSQGGGSPFDWTIPADATGILSLGEGEDGAGLRAVPVDRSPASALVSELLVLPPGAYRLSGRVSIPGASTVQSDGFDWSLRCAESGQVIGHAGAAPAGEGWTAFAEIFTVPVDGCQGQWLELLRHPTFDEPASASPVLFDQMTLSPERGGAVGQERNTQPAT